MKMIQVQGRPFELTKEKIARMHVDVDLLNLCVFNTIMRDVSNAMGERLESCLRYTGNHWVVLKDVLTVYYGCMISVTFNYNSSDDVCVTIASPLHTLFIGKHSSSLGIALCKAALEMWLEEPE